MDGGYLGWEAVGDAGYPVARYSTDGLTWTHADLAKEVTPCPGWTARPDGEVSAGATNGHSVVLVGLEYAPGDATCGTWQAAAWVTTDGTSWQRAPGFGAAARGNALVRRCLGDAQRLGGRYQGPDTSPSGNPQMGSPGRPRRRWRKEIPDRVTLPPPTGPVSSSSPTTRPIRHTADVQGRPGLAPDRWSAPDPRRDRTHPGTGHRHPPWMIVPTRTTPTSRRSGAPPISGTGTLAVPDAGGRGDRSHGLRAAGLRRGPLSRHRQSVRGRSVAVFPEPRRKVVDTARRRCRRRHLRRGWRGRGRHRLSEAQARTPSHSGDWNLLGGRGLPVFRPSPGREVRLRRTCASRPSRRSPSPVSSARPRPKVSTGSVSTGSRPTTLKALKAYFARLAEAGVKPSVIRARATR